MAFLTLFYVDQLFLKGIIFYGEEKGFINYDFVNYRFQSLWNFSENFGSPTSAFINMFTTGSIWKIANILGLGLFDSARFFYALVIFVTLLFSYLLFLHLSKNKLFSLLLAAVYITVYNFYASLQTTPKLLHFAILPISLFFWFKYYDTNKRIYPVLNILFLILTLGIGINPPQMIGAYMCIAAVVLFSLLKRPRQVVVYLLPYLLTTLYVFVVNMIVIVYSGSIFSFDAFAINWSATDSKTYDILRFFGAWWDYAGNEGQFYNHLIGYYHSTPGILISYFPLFAFLTMLIISLSKNFGMKIKILMVLALFIFLTKGSAPIFKNIFDIFFSIPLFKIFREPWAKFIINVIFITLFGIAFFFHDIKKYSEKYLIFFLLSIYLVFQVVPLVTRDAVDHRNKDWKVTDVKVPKYWLDLLEWSKKNNRDARILILPADTTTNENLVYNWKPYTYTGNPAELLLYDNIITNYGSNYEEQKVMQVFFNSLSANSLKQYSIDYVLDVSDDLKNVPANTVSVDSVESGITQGNPIVFGPLKLWPVRKDHLLPKIRLVEYSDEILGLCKGTALTPNDNISYLSVKTNQINETSYRIEVPKQNGSRLSLIFADLFNSGWGLYTSAFPLFEKPLPNVQHEVGECFLNTWILDSKDLQGKSLYIVYKPQVYLTAATYGFFILSLLYILGVYLYKKDSLHFQLGKRSEKYIARFTALYKKSSTLERYFHIVRALFLAAAAYFFVTDIASPVFSNMRVLLFIIFWILFFVAYKQNAIIDIVVALVLLISLVVTRALDNLVYSEKIAIWIFVFIALGAIQLGIEYVFKIVPRGLDYFVTHAKMDWELFRKSSELPLAILNKIVDSIKTLIIRLYGPRPKTQNEYRTLGIRILITIVVCILFFFAYQVVKTQQLRLSQNPDVEKIEPFIVYRSIKVIIKGNNLGFKPNQKELRLMSQYGEVQKDNWTDKEIVFTVPLHWKDGEVDLWIEKPVEWEGKKIIARSRTIKLKLIPTTQTFTEDDDLYFKQLPNLDDKTLKLNGYDPTIYKK